MSVTGPLLPLQCCTESACYCVLVTLFRVRFTVFLVRLLCLADPSLIRFVGVIIVTAVPLSTPGNCWNVA